MAALFTLTSDDGLTMLAPTTTESKVAQASAGTCAALMQRDPVTLTALPPAITELTAAAPGTDAMFTTTPTTSDFFELRSASTPAGPDAFFLCAQYAPTQATAGSQAPTAFTAVWGTAAAGEGRLLCCAPDWSDAQGLPQHALLVLMSPEDRWPKMLCLGSGTGQRVYALPVICGDSGKCPLDWQGCNNLTGTCADHAQLKSSAWSANQPKTPASVNTTNRVVAPNCFGHMLAGLRSTSLTASTCAEHPAAQTSSQATAAAAAANASNARFWDSALIGGLAVVVCLLGVIVLFGFRIWMEGHPVHSRKQRPRHKRP